MGSRSNSRELRAWFARAFSGVEDVVYVGLGILLALSAASLLVTGGIALAKSILSGAPLQGVVDLFDRTLIALMIVELLYTLQVSFREHALVPEPFLVVGLIAVVRRILVLTAEFATVIESGGETKFRNAVIELGLLTLMVVALVVSLMVLRKAGAKISSK